MSELKTHEQMIDSELKAIRLIREAINEMQKVKDYKFSNNLKLSAMGDNETTKLMNICCNRIMSISEIENIPNFWGHPK
jgi:hypothetical protein